MSTICPWSPFLIIWSFAVVLLLISKTQRHRKIDKVRYRKSLIPDFRRIFLSFQTASQQLPLLCSSVLKSFSLIIEQRYFNWLINLSSWLETFILVESSLSLFPVIFFLALIFLPYLEDMLFLKRLKLLRKYQDILA